MRTIKPLAERLPPDAATYTSFHESRSRLPEPGRPPSNDFTPDDDVPLRDLDDENLPPWMMSLAVSLGLLIGILAAFIFLWR